jgi:hypothetical protein
LNDLIRGQINPDLFDAAWKTYTELSKDIQQRLSDEFFEKNKQNQLLPIASLTKIVLHFENMIDTATSNPDIKKSFTTWFVNQLIANFKDHKEEMATLLHGLKYKREYAEKFLTSESPRDRCLLDVFLPLFVSGAEGKRSLDNWFIQYVIQQFAVPLDKIWTDQEYRNYQNDVKTMFQNAHWKPFVLSFCETLLGSHQKEQLLFHLNLLLSGVQQDFKIVDETMKQIVSFVKSRSQETQSRFFDLVLNQVFPAVKEPPMKYLLYNYFLINENNKLSGEFCQQNMPDVVEGARWFPK